MRSMELSEVDYDEEVEALADFFAGRSSPMSDFLNPHGGHHILARGTAQVFYGTRAGITVYDDFEQATDVLPADSACTTSSPTAIPGGSGTRTARSSSPGRTMTARSWSSFASSPPPASGSGVSSNTASTCPRRGCRTRQAAIVLVLVRRVH